MMTDNESRDNLAAGKAPVRPVEEVGSAWPERAISWNAAADIHFKRWLAGNHAG